MRKLGVDEWLVKIVQSMYTDARSRVRVNDSLREEFSVKVGVHQGSVLSPLLFIHSKYAFRAKLLSRSDVLYSRSVPRHWSKKRRLLEKLLPPRREVFFYFIILFLVSSVWLFCFCVYLTLLTQSLLNF